ncbi:hypothetical protein G7Y79_00001g003470 [Physcia stellaris]|nr:hypothetical protein G7Y79_00001g003470 [Physcia stellaris]
MDMQSSMVMSSTVAGMGSMAMGTPTAMSSAMPTATAAMSSSMDMDMDMGSCKISVRPHSTHPPPPPPPDPKPTNHHQTEQMLWNWNTIDACFISSSWHITSKSMFAGSCIGVILLVCTLELLRRLGREYDRYIILTASSSNLVLSRDIASKTGTTSRVEGASSSSDDDSSRFPALPLGRRSRPTLPQQMVRAVLHMLQFGVAYFIMLLAMYYNGYFIICILLGALIGAFAFSWDLSLPAGSGSGGVAASKGGRERGREGGKERLFYEEFYDGGWAGGGFHRTFMMYEMVMELTVDSRLFSIYLGICVR